MVSAEIRKKYLPGRMPSTHKVDSAGHLTTCPNFGRYLRKLCQSQLLCLLLRDWVLLLWRRVGASLSAHNDKLPICKRAEVKLAVKPSHLLRCMWQKHSTALACCLTGTLQLLQCSVTAWYKLDAIHSSPGMKMTLRVCSECSEKMLLHTFNVATSVPQATASDDKVSTVLCSLRCRTKAPLPSVCSRQAQLSHLC